MRKRKNEAVLHDDDLEVESDFSDSDEVEIASGI